MAGSWVPLHENHAINVMGLSIAFGEAIPALLYRKVMAGLDRRAVELGLMHKQPMMGAQVSFGANGINTSEQVWPGALFSAFFEQELSIGVPPQPSEQLQIDPGRIVIRTWSYVSWTWQKDRMLNVIKDALQLIAGVVSVANIRLEYQDRFCFEGSPSEAFPDKLLNKSSKYISPHVFSELGMWHSHTGHFLPSVDASSSLLQINIDAIDENADVIPQRWITITTARENRYNTAIDQAIPITLDLVSNVIENQHVDLIDTLDQLINNSTAKKIYLKG